MAMGKLGQQYERFRIFHIHFKGPSKPGPVAIIELLYGKGVLKTNQEQSEACVSWVRMLMFNQALKKNYNGRGTVMSRVEYLYRNGIELYPPRVNRSHTVLQAQNPEVNQYYSTIAGRLIGLNLGTKKGELKDWSGTIKLELGKSEIANVVHLFVEGDLVECRGIWKQDIYDIVAIKLLAPNLRDEPESNIIGAIKLRARLLNQTRVFFESHEFISVDTPTLSIVPDLTPEIRSFRTDFINNNDASKPLYLQTSPEHYMKRLLAAGCERIYQICRFYRNSERFATHHPEFTGLEWYEAYADYEAVMATTEAYISFLAEALKQEKRLIYQGTTIDLQPPWPRFRVKELFLKYTGIDLDYCQTDIKFASKARQKGYEFQEGDSWGDLFHRIFITAIEQNLPSETPAFVIDYPVQLPSLARATPEDPRYVERFELYIGGLELANAFTELNDPVEQRKRFETDLLIKKDTEGYTGGVDEAFLLALESGMPPSGGIALGLDRLMMLFSDVTTLDSIIMFRNH